MSNKQLWGCMCSWSAFVLLVLIGVGWILGEHIIAGVVVIWQATGLPALFALLITVQFAAATVWLYRLLKEVLEILWKIHALLHQEQLDRQWMRRHLERENRGWEDF